jgi:hypothetical protein
VWRHGPTITAISDEAGSYEIRRNGTLVGRVEYFKSERSWRGIPHVSVNYRIYGRSMRDAAISVGNAWELVKLPPGMR